MGQTVTQKILANHIGEGYVKPGQLIDAGVDLVLLNDITGPPAIREFRKVGAEHVFDPEKVVLVNDHYAPNKDAKSANQCMAMRGFAYDQGIAAFFDMVGIEHTLLPEEGLVRPGDLVIGADSHTCTYGALGAFSTGVGSTDAAAAMISGKCWLRVPESMKFVYRGEMPDLLTGKDLILYTIGDIGVDGATYRAMEFTGEVIRKLSMAERSTMCNMAVEAGAKNGIMEANSMLVRDLGGEWSRSDPDAEYRDVREYDVSGIEPQVAYPSLPSNAHPISEVQEEEIEVDQVVIGSCTNGRIEDLRQMAKVLKGRKLAKYLRLIVIPATRRVFQQGIDEGIERIVTDMGGVYSTPTCGPCLGGHMGVLADGEVCLATTNRNFVGRMGNPKGEVYLSSPYIAAATAVKGYICSPEVLE